MLPAVSALARKSGCATFYLVEPHTRRVTWHPTAVPSADRVLYVGTLRVLPEAEAKATAAYLRVGSSYYSWRLPLEAHLAQA